MPTTALTETQREARRAANYKWRKANPAKRQAQSKSNLDKGAHSTNLYQRWTAEEDERVIAHSVTDRDLARELGRSVRSICSRRAKLKKLFPDKFPAPEPSVQGYRFSAVKLRFWREERGWSQAQCEKWMGVKRNRLSEWETGFRRPDASNTLRLCLLLNVHPRDLCEQDRDSKNDNIAEQKLC